jgi:nucleotide-binding universal stress UspA family protein
MRAAAAGVRQEHATARVGGDRARMQTTPAGPSPATSTRHPFERVLVAASLDAAGARAAVRAARLPLAPGARVVLVHVIEPSRDGSARAPSATQGLARLAAGAKDAAVAAGNEDPELVPLLAEGPAPEEIVRAAWQERAELIVAGAPSTRRDGSARPTIFEVLRSADLPLLVARRDGWEPYRRVVCAVDRTVTTVDAVALAARIARATAAEFTLFNAFRVPFEPWMAGDVTALEREAHALLRDVADSVRDELGEVRTVARRGTPSSEILRTVLRERADLLAVGTHGRTGLARAVLGSAAEWTIAACPCDVAVARPHRLPLERR